MVPVCQVWPAGAVLVESTPSKDCLACRLLPALLAYAGGVAAFVALMLCAAGVWAVHGKLDAIALCWSVRSLSCKKLSHACYEVFTRVSIGSEQAVSVTPCLSC